MLTISGTLNTDQDQVTFEVFTDQELNPADNVVVVTIGETGEGGGGCGCGSGAGSSTLLSYRSRAW
ncbi:MAG: hypothetical protein AB7P03_28260 [Kofleriaceae bacterium]